jgi:hypothetical protein
MSRGLGTEQRWLLDHLASDPDGHDEAGLPLGSLLLDVIERRYGSEPTRAQSEALRRAARTLATRELVESWTSGFDYWYAADDDDTRKRWRERYAHVRRVTWVRRAPSVDELRAAWERCRDEYEAAPEQWEEREGFSLRFYGPGSDLVGPRLDWGRRMERIADELEERGVSVARPELSRESQPSDADVASETPSNQSQRSDADVVTGAPEAESQHIAPLLDLRIALDELEEALAAVDTAMVWGAQTRSRLRRRGSSRGPRRVGARPTAS